MKYAAPPVCTTTGPATKTIRRPAARVSRISVAMRPTLASTRRSDEISFDMNAKSPRSRSRNSGVTRMPSRPQTTRSPARISRSFRHEARLSSIDHHRVHALALDLDPLAADAHVGAQVGGRIEVVRDAAVAVGGRAAARRASRAGLQPSCIRSSTRRRRPAALGADTFSEMRENSSLVRPIAKFEDLEGAAALDHLVEDRVENVRVDQVAFGADHRGVSVSVLHGR